MLDFFRDFLFVLAGLSTVIQYKVAGTKFDDAVMKIAVSYGLIAILFQFLSHVFEKMLEKYKENHELGVKEQAWKVLIVIVTFIISFVVTNLLIPVGHPGV